MKNMDAEKMYVAALFSCGSPITMSTKTPATIATVNQTIIPTSFMYFDICPRQRREMAPREPHVATIAPASAELKPICSCANCIPSVSNDAMLPLVVALIAMQPNMQASYVVKPNIVFDSASSSIAARFLDFWIPGFLAGDVRCLSLKNLKSMKIMIRTRIVMKYAGAVYSFRTKYLVSTDKLPFWKIARNMDPMKGVTVKPAYSTAVIHAI
mmetsp:Transcript_10961/g.16318  ORF Transcript_10961/g.16318 Transcript_10961/m.16318 type:complete len:212 (+) Transcript_10961:426-1061(+)